MIELFQDPRPEAPNHFEEPLSIYDARAAAQIAQALLSRSGWTGAQIQELERVAAMQETDPDVLEWMEHMQDARDREDALNK